MRECCWLLATALLLWAAPADSFELPVQPDDPFRAYTVADGLNQRTVIAVEQDQDGYLWVATFGGLNRFDGRTFESFTTHQGLRQNLVQALMVDTSNRLWVGDAAGGLTVFENGVVTNTYAPSDNVRGVARALLQVDDALYIGTQPGGLRRLDLTRTDATPSQVEGAPDEVFDLVRQGRDHILVLSSEGLLRFEFTGDGSFERLDASVSALAAADNGTVFVGTRDGRVGTLIDDLVQWSDIQYPAIISSLVADDEQLVWVGMEAYGLVRFGDDPSQAMPATATGGTPEIDNSGSLWVPTRRGLLHYLGKRFRHYSLLFDGLSPEVYAILPGDDQSVWFGTNLGLLRMNGDGTLVNISDQLGIERREVRGIHYSDDRKALWIAQVGGQTHAIDLNELTLGQSIGDQNAITVSLARDQMGNFWAGSYLGHLDRIDPDDGSVTSHEIGPGAAIYGLDIADDGVVWFTASYHGLFRLDTRIPGASPVKVVDASEIEDEFFTHAAVEGVGEQTKVWFTSAQGGVYRWAGGKIERVVSREDLQFNTAYAVQPLPDGMVIITTSRGVYQYDQRRERIAHYNAEDGFVAIESKPHSIYYDGVDTLWIGTTTGATSMDVSRPMARVGVPNTLITDRSVDGVRIGVDQPIPSELTASQVLIRFGAITMRKPGDVQFSYRLIGSDEAWSPPTANESINFSNLAPGQYTFEVRARLPGGQWSRPDRWLFVVPTPYWRTPWFVALCLLGGLALTAAVVQLRLRAIAHTNARLRREVAERTRSLEEGRAELEKMNSQLSSEIAERQRADAARADVEARFHQAYRNSPIGMALVDTAGLVYDANPAMRHLFWPNSHTEEKELLGIVCEEDQSAFSEFFAGFASRVHESGVRDNPSMEVACRGADSSIRYIDFHPSAVRDNNGELKYIVLLANDVTESRAMTDQLAYQARYDELTGLYNRRAFAEQLESLHEARSADDGSYLMFLDLDQFKVVNDTSGHAAGDELLRKLAELITQQVRPDDIVARLGGDEFGVVLRHCSADVAMARAERIRESIHDYEFIWDAQVFRVGVSIGVVAVDGADRDLNELQQLADAACYAAKEAGRNRVHMVASDSDAVHEHRGEMRWVQRLNHAIDTDSFELFGQRIVALSGDVDQPERIEVLLRMRDRNNDRLIPPNAFLPAAERYGLHGRLDQWVVRQVINVLQVQAPEEVAKQEIWVNLSGGTVGDAKQSRDLVRQVAEANLPAGSLNFEITETSVIRRIDDAIRLIAALRGMGCRFALDDFGSGLSSFGYLKRLNVDCLKIDGQFVRDIAHDETDRIFVKSIIDIAHTLGMKIVAEFVENEQVLEEIQRLGSDYGQGFGIHRPEQLENMVTLTTVIRNAGL